jgi:hypothetical protein
MRMIIMMMIASVEFWKTNESIAAITSNKVIGLLNCNRKRKTTETLDFPFRELGPYCFLRAIATPSARPLLLLPDLLRASSEERLQKAFSFSVIGIAILYNSLQT